MDAGGLLLLAIFLWLLLLLSRRPQKGNLPPGPPPLPLLGNLLHLAHRGLLMSFLAFQDKYGDVFTVYLGTRPAVVICGPEAVKEAVVKNAKVFSDRGILAIADSIFQGYGFFSSGNQQWKTLRRFSITALRDLGMGKKSVEEKIKTEAQCLVEELRKSQGALLDPTFLFHSAMANIICSLVFSERFSYQDTQFQGLLNMLTEAFTIISSSWMQLFEQFPHLLKFFPGPHCRVLKIAQHAKDFIASHVEKHQETLDPSAPRDFTDSFLLHIEKEQEVPGSAFDQKSLIFTILNLFFAGTETTSTTPRYGCLLLLKYPQVAEKVQQEIDHVIGKNRPPELKDRAKMPYTDAVIHEIQRFSDLLPLGLPHMVTEDTSFQGYLLPKGINVFLFLSSSLKDPRHFEKPHIFDPNHFLDAQGALKKNEAFIPFSMGKRICLGEGIARSELFLFLTTILQNFSLVSLKPPEDLDIRPRESGLGTLPPIYELCFLPR
ncbi:cytochrome P450 2B11-like [Trichosurus vulpecula]|uniref:cytochrome P450 2B11-like n=1 Tax=Trichosurus vulpecula TaxID=9337 RepID=UPI00186B0474|nr:cytochrome P450 2B11-like [Trichosurus vulpecula]